MNLWKGLDGAVRRVVGIDCPVCRGTLVQPDGAKLYAKVGGTFMVLSFCPKRDYIKLLGMGLGAPVLELTGDDAAQEIEFRVGESFEEEVRP
jgi:hypothetical protein